MAKYKTKKYSARESLYKFNKESYYRQKAYEKFSKEYDKLFEKYGNGMAPKMSKETFYKVTREELSAAIATGSRYKYSGARIANLQIVTTLKEGRSGARNFNRNIEDLNYRVATGHASRTEENVAVEISAILQKYNKKKLTSSDIRANGPLWKEIYDVLKKNNATEKTMGSK